MAGSVTRKHIHKDFEIIGVYSSAANYLIGINKSSAEEGMCYYDTTLNQLRTYDGTSWSAAGLSSQSAGSLDDAANLGAKITLDFATAGIEIEGTDTYVTADGACLLIDNNDTGSDIHSLEITHTGTAAALEFTQATSTTNDIRGNAGVWYVTGDGHGVFQKLSLGDSANLYLGDTAGTGDVTIHFNDAIAKGTTKGGLLFNAVAADEQIQFGTSAYSFDVWFCGNTSSTNKMLWDLDGGEDSVGALILDNADIDLGDNDQIRLGDSQDFTIDYNGSSLLVVPAADNDDIIFGTTALGVTLTAYGATATSILEWNSTNDRLIFKSAATSTDVMLQLDDNIAIAFGEGSNFGTTGSGDWQMYSLSTSNTPLTILPSATNSIVVVGNSGGTAVADLQWYTTTAGKGFFIDASGDVAYMDGADFRLNDDDYLCLGDSATGGGANDGTIRWDSTESLIEIIGNAKFEGNLTVANITVTGTLTHSGDYDPSSMSLDDNETFYWGTGNDVAMKFDATDLAIDGASANMGIVFGKTTVCDIRIDGANYDIRWDASKNHLLFQDNAICAFGGTSGSNADYKISTAGSTGALIITAATANDCVTIGDGTVATDFKIDNITTSGADIWWDQSADAAKGTMYWGNDGKGIDCKWFSENASDYILWDMDLNTNGVLIFEGAAANFTDATLCTFGTGVAAGDGDIKLYGDSSAVFHIGQVVTDIGTIEIGADGEGIDVKFFGETSGSDMLWDESADGLLFPDATNLFIGNSAASPDLKIWSNGTSLAMVIAVNMDITGEGKELTFGKTGTHGLDIVWQSATAGTKMTFDAGASTFTITNPLQQVFAASDINYTVNTATDSNYLVFAASDDADSRVIFGTTTANGLDFYLQAATTSSYIKFDAAASTFTFNHNVQQVFTGSAVHYYTNVGTDSTYLKVIATDSSGAKIIFGSSGGTNGMDVRLQGKSASTYVEWDAGASTFTFNDTCQQVFCGSAVHYYTNIGTSSTYLKVTATDSAGAQIIFGSSGGTNGLDVTLQAATLSSHIKFDAGASTFTINQPVQQIFSASDINYTINTATGSNYLMIAASNNAASRVIFGTTTANGLDFYLQGATTSSLIKFDAGASTFTIQHNIQQIFAGSTCSYMLNTATGSNYLMISATDNAASRVIFGTTTANGLDVYFQGDTTSSLMKFDAGASTFTIQHNIQQIFAGSTISYMINTATGSNFLVITGTDNAATKIIVGSSATTNSVDFVLQGAAASQTITWNAGTGYLTATSLCNIVTTYSASGTGLVIPVLAGVPATTAVSGAIVLDTTNSDLYVFKTNAWVKVAVA